MGKIHWEIKTKTERSTIDIEVDDKILQDLLDDLVEAIAMGYGQLSQKKAFMKFAEDEKSGKLNIEEED